MYGAVSCPGRNKSPVKSLILCRNDRTVLGVELPVPPPVFAHQDVLLNKKRLGLPSLVIPDHDITINLHIYKLACMG